MLFGGISSGKWPQWNSLSFQEVLSSSRIAVISCYAKILKWGISRVCLSHSDFVLRNCWAMNEVLFLVTIHDLIEAVAGFKKIDQFSTLMRPHRLQSSESMCEVFLIFFIVLYIWHEAVYYFILLTFLCEFSSMSWSLMEKWWSRRNHDKFVIFSNELFTHLMQLVTVTEWYHSIIIIIIIITEGWLDQPKCWESRVTDDKYHGNLLSDKVHKFNQNLEIDGDTRSKFIQFIASFVFDSLPQIFMYVTFLTMSRYSLIFGTTLQLCIHFYCEFKMFSVTVLKVGVNVYSLFFQ